VAGVTGSSVALQIAVAADYGVDLLELGERVWREVGQAVTDVSGLAPVEITVIIDAVLGPGR
jgi:uncharacterized alkaline shock family protein YloU